MHNSLKRAVSIAIAAIALFSLPCGSIFARTHIDIDKKYDSIIVAVSHNQFMKFDFMKYRDEGTIIFDVKACLNRDLVDGRL